MILCEGLVSRCAACKHKADSARFITRGKELGELRRKDEYRWYQPGDKYVYAILYPGTLKIGYAARTPNSVFSSSNQRYTKYSGFHVKGTWLWQRTGATYADEAVLQGVMTRQYGAAFPPRTGVTRMSEWVCCVSEEMALTCLNSTWSFLGALAPNTIN